MWYSNFLLNSLLTVISASLLMFCVTQTFNCPPRFVEEVPNNSTALLYGTPHERMSRIRKALSKSQSQFSSVAKYLSHCRLNESNTTSNVFIGTLYELHVRDELQNLMGLNNLEYFGGAYDNGRDLGGKFDVSPHITPPKELILPSRVRGKQIKPMALRKSTQMDILVQCKSFSSKIQAKEIRELSGIFQFNVMPKNKYTTLGIMTSPSMLTSQAQEQMDRTDFPLAFVQIPRLRFIGNDVYDPLNYTRLEPRGIYLNPLTYALWQGTDLLHLSHKIAC